MIIKCKMCGGDIEFTPGATYGTCEYCGSTSTIPKADDESKLNRYNRANHFRRQCEFDKALTAYEKILDTDDTDAEAHWGAVLSRYGIEYVEDPATGKRIPTCHRLQVTSILADADYLAAVENAPDAESRRLYEEQATQIAEIQKGILAISANEKPYDVFICYKESDDNGQRTHDSQWAQEVYYGLTDAGYKVFFSRITLEDKLGTQYEPYIFAALNSAKVMVVIGSKPEYFNAVWVKNEWSRYLALMAQDRKRLLIPCYRDMDPYDLPEELSALQSQDMSKIGFMQDLLRGVKKVLEAEKKPDHVVRTVTQSAASTSTVAAPGVASLMERAYLFMEDKDFASANSYLNRVLDIDPKYASAYAAKVCVTFACRKESQLADLNFLFADNTDWQKALRFSNADQKAKYEGYYAQVKLRVTKQIRDYAFDCAIEMAVNPDASYSKLDNQYEQYRRACSSSEDGNPVVTRRQDAEMNSQTFRNAVLKNEPGEVSEEAYRTAAGMFQAIGDDEASICADQCLTLAEQARQKAIYEKAMMGTNSSDIQSLQESANIFLTIPDYKDARQQAQKCWDTIESIRMKLYNGPVSAMESAGDSSELWKDIIWKLSCQELDGYRDTEQLLKKAKARYQECVDEEERQSRMREEKQRREKERAAAIRKRNRIIAVTLLVIMAAAAVLTVKVVIPNYHYKKAVEYRAANNWDEAIAEFIEAGDYSDAATQVSATYYTEGETKRDSGDWDGAVTAFTNAGNYSDAATQITETEYQHAQSMYDSGDYASAYLAYEAIAGYKDVDTLLASDNNLTAAAAAAAAREAKFTVGNYVELGTYPQTSSGTDSTPIEWLVLARDGDNALLISRYGLDVQPYNEEWEYTTWEKCTLRTWLNTDFYNKAFSADDKQHIIKSNVTADRNPDYSTNPGNATTDNVFLLSIDEVNKYFVSNEDRICYSTDYSKEQGAYTSDSGACWWWLRSPGDGSNNAARVGSDGSVYGYGRSVSNSYSSVRPAVWVRLF